MLKAIIFDWGGVLVDAETKKQFAEARSILEYCKSKGYRLALACIASKFEDRKRQIEDSDLKNFFEFILVEPMPVEKIWDPAYKGKDDVFDRVKNYLKLPADEVLIIDDRTVRGVRYANQCGHPSIWVKHGKFANELPNEQTGQPTYTITHPKEVIGLI